MASVRFPTAPEGGPEAIGRALGDLRASTSSDALGGGKISLTQPFPVYALDVTRFDRSSDIEKAKLIGWRYVVLSPSEDDISFADIKLVGGAAHFTRLSKSRNAVRLLEAAEVAQDVAERTDIDYEARILEIPQIYFSAVWLSGSHPWLIPYINGTALFVRNSSIVAQPVEYLAQLIADRRSDRG